MPTSLPDRLPDIAQTEDALGAQLARLSPSVVTFHFNGSEYYGLRQADWMALCDRGEVGADLRGRLAGRLLSSGEMFVVFGEADALAPMAYRSVARVLTQRELKVASLIADGLTDKEIARTLGISAYTVREHCRRACAKLGICKRSALVRALYATTRPS